MEGENNNQIDRNPEFAMSYNPSSFVEQYLSTATYNPMSRLEKAKIKGGK